MNNDACRATDKHIKELAEEKNICIVEMNVQPEHMHLLVKLSSDQLLEDIAKLIKGESSHWINQNDVVQGKFSWQTGYAAFSVGYDGLDVVKQYIRNQDEHHKRRTFVEEVKQMLCGAGFSEVEVEEILKV